jgi:hypothetical protein
VCQACCPGWFASATRLFAQMAVDARAAGRTLPMADGYITASASARGFAAAKRKLLHFKGSGCGRDGDGSGRAGEESVAPRDSSFPRQIWRLAMPCT